MRRLGRQLGRQRVVEQPPARGQRDHAPLLAQLDRVDAVAGAQRAPPSRRRAAPSRRRRRTACRRPAPPLSVVVARGSTQSNVCPSASALATCRWPRNQSNQLREQREDVNVHRRTPGRRRSGAPSRSIERIASRTSGISAVADLERLARRAARPSARTTPTSRSPSTTRQPARSRAQNSPSSSGGASASGTRSSVPRSASASSRDSRSPRSRRIGFSGVPCAARQDDAAVAQQQLVAAGQQRGVGARPRETTRRARAAGRRSRPAASRYSTMSTRTRRLSLTAAALTTVRSACAVRPPRPMTCP